VPSQFALDAQGFAQAGVRGTQISLFTLDNAQVNKPNSESGSVNLKLLIRQFSLNL
jgi:hypothetical protein